MSDGNLGPFAVMNEDFQLYLINFHIAREAFRRGELPPDEIMDFLYEGAITNLPQTAYEQEARDSRENLDRIVQIAISNFARGGVPKKAATREGEVDAISYERDPRTKISYVISGIKGIERFWRKSFGNVAAQKETGFFDHKRFRIVVEMPEARAYRSRREYRNLSQQEKKEFEREFGGKKFNRLSPAEKERFYRRFAADYGGLTEAEKAEYKKRFQELQRRACRNLAKDIALLRALDTIPQKPHYMVLDGLEIRVQTQAVVDNNGERLLGFDYLMVRGSSHPRNGLFEMILKSIPSDYMQRSGNTARYMGTEGSEHHAVDLGSLVINYHLPQNPSRIDLESLTKKIHQNYLRAQRTADENEERSGKDFSAKTYRDKRDTAIMEGIKLGMPDIPLGLFIFSETTSKDLEIKYPGIGVDVSMAFDMFVKDRTGKNAEANGYEDVKLYLCFGPQAKQLSGECQIRDTISDWIAEFGPASAFHEEQGHLAESAARASRATGKEIRPLSDEEQRFGVAFFGNNKLSRQALSEVYADFYSRAIYRTIERIIQIEGIRAEPTRFEKLFGEIKSLVRKAKERVDQGQLEEKVAAAANSTFSRYMESKGMAVLTYLDSLWEINSALRNASAELSVQFRYLDSAEKLSELLHTRHIHLLYEAYTRLASSNDVVDVGAALFVGRLIRNYGRYYGPHLPRETQDEYVGLVERFCKTRGWKLFKFGNPTLGYIPPNFLKHDRMKETIRKGLEFNPESTRFREFDITDLGNLAKLYGSVVR